MTNEQLQELRRDLTTPVIAGSVSEIIETKDARRIVVIEYQDARFPLCTDQLRIINPNFSVGQAVEIVVRPRQEEDF